MVDQENIINKSHINIYCSQICFKGRLQLSKEIDHHPTGLFFTDKGEL